MNKPNIIAGILGMLLSCYIFFTAMKFPKPPATLLGPDFFPMILSLGLFIFSLSLLVQAILKKCNVEYEKMDIKSPEVIRSSMSLVATLIYVLLMQFIGFITATIIYLLFLMYLLKNREYVKMGIVSIVVSIIIYLLFKNLLHITLPSGLLI